MVDVSQPKIVTDGEAPQAPSSLKWDDLIQQDRVHRTLYTDPGIFAGEMVKIYGGTWVYVAHESEVSNANDFKKTLLGGRSVIVTRDRDGALHVLLNRCRHRGATVCRENRGNARTFVCGYHGWTYQNTGKLVGVPGLQGYGPQFDKSAFGLGRVPRVESYRGFIFATLNREAPPLLEHLGNAQDLVDQWLDRSPEGQVKVSGAQRYEYRGNWKLAYDNAADGYHVPYSHESLLTMTTERYGGGDIEYFADADAGPMYVQYLGNGHTFVDQRPEFHKVSAWRQQRPQPSREAYEAQLRAKLGDEEAEPLLELAVGSGMNLNIFPNLLLIGNQIQVIQPLAANRTVLEWYATTIDGVPDEINKLRMRTQEDFPILGEVDDNANFEGCQIGMEIPEIEWVDMSRHLDSPQETTDDQGVLTGPVTSDLHLRGYYQEWKRLMNTEPAIVID